MLTVQNLDEIREHAVNLDQNRGKYRLIEVLSNAITFSIPEDVNPEAFAQSCGDACGKDVDFVSETHGARQIVVICSAF